VIYFDHNASTPVRPEALEAMVGCLRTLSANPSSAHREGQRARADQFGKPSFRAAPHELHLERRLVAQDLLAFELSESVLGADRAAEVRDAVVDDAVDRRLVGEERLRVSAGRRRDVVVQVAVAEMTEAHQANLGKGARHGGVGGLARMAHDLLLRGYLESEESQELGEAFRGKRKPDAGKFGR